MAACPGCGANNDAGLARCEYCGTPLGESSTMVLEWSASTGEGAHASGHVELTVPAGADAAKVKAQITAAYSKAVDAVGADAEPDRVRDALWTELERLLPPEQKLKDLSLGSHQVLKPGESPSASSGCAKGALLTGLFAAVSLCCAFGGGLMQADFLQQAELIETKAKVVTLEEAASTTGLVILESVTPTIPPDQQAIMVPDEDVACLTLEGGRKNAQGQKEPFDERVPSFEVGGLTVETAELKLHDTPPLGLKSNSGAVWKGFKADTPITLVGEQKDGVFRGGELFMIAPQPSKEALVADLRKDAQAVWVFEWLCGGIGVLMILVTALLARRKP